MIRRPLFCFKDTKNSGQLIFNFLKPKKLIFNFFVNRLTEKITNSRTKAKILADNRKSQRYPIETLLSDKLDQNPLEISLCCPLEQGWIGLRSVQESWRQLPGKIHHGILMFYVLCFCLWFSQCYSNLIFFFHFHGFVFPFWAWGFCSRSLFLFFVFLVLCFLFALCVSVLRFGLCVFVHFINNRISDGCVPPGS